MKVLTRFQGELLREYNRTRKLLRTRLKRRMEPTEAIPFIKEAFAELTARQAKIILQYTYKTFKKGILAAKKETKGATIAAAAASHLSAVALSDTLGVDLDSVSQKQMLRIMHHNLGAIGKYNITLSKAHQAQYNLLLNDNRLLKSLDTHGWTPWLEEEWKKRGIAPEIIKLVKGQKTSAQMIQILEYNGIRGGMHPNEVGRRLVPYVNRFFGPEGVVIDKIGKSVNRLAVDADGNYEWAKHKITKTYRATPRTYSRMLARNVLREARMDAYYDTLAKSKLVDHYISVAHMDSNTCAHCAMMHGQTVTKGTGPQYHANCGCDLRPAWKKDSPLASQNKPDAFYEKQRNAHFLRMNDLKEYNAKMPRGIKLKYATQLPEDAITKVTPGDIKMRAIRHEMLGEPQKITPALEKAISPIKVEPPIREEKWGLTDKQWQKEASTLFKKTAQDGKEHIRLLNGLLKEYKGTSDKVSFQIPKTDFISIHTHPGWDSPLSSQDFISFLSTPKEHVSAATTKRHIYIIRKTTKTEHIESQLGVNFVKREFAAEKDKIMARMLKEREGYGPMPDLTEVYVKVGKIMAKRFGLEYKILKR